MCHTFLKYFWATLNFLETKLYQEIHVLFRKIVESLFSISENMRFFGRPYSANLQLILDCHTPKFKMKYDYQENLKQIV